MQRVSVPVTFRRLRGGPAVPLALLVLAQWIAIAIFAAVVRRNGWLFYQGGDQTFFYTDAWVLGHGHVPQSQIGYAWSFVLMPLTWIFGPNFLTALPAIVLLQVVVLQPVALVAVYGIAARIAGRAIGYLAVVLWIATPFLVIPLWDHRYHGKYVEQFLPQGLGLTGLGDFPSMVALLVAAYFCLRAIDTAALPDALAGGVAAGFAIGIKPANALFLFAPAAGYLLARRFRPGLAFVAGLLPGALALVLWKQRGLGYLPLLHPEVHALAAGARPFVTGSLSDNLNLRWSQLQNNNANFREFFWSPRAVEWVPVAGAIGIARLSVSKSGLLCAWFLAFLIVKGMSPGASVEKGTFLRLFLPGFPPYLLLAAAVPLLVPRSGPSIGARFTAPVTGLHWKRAPWLACVAVLGLLPLALVAALPPLKGGSAAELPDASVFVPAAVDFGLRARPNQRGGYDLSWRAQTAPSTSVFYKVYRSPALFKLPKGSPDNFPTVRRGLLCEASPGGADKCSIEMAGVATSPIAAATEAPPRGHWTYRVAMVANWRNDQQAGDPVLISTPVDVTVD